MISRILLLIALTGLAVESATLFRVESVDKALEKYDKRIPPNSGSSPIQVEASMYIVRMYEFNEVDKNFNIDLYFRQRWMDERLAYTAKNETDQLKGGAQLLESIWTPDTFFPLGHRDTLNTVTTANVFVSIKPSGEVMTSGRYSTNVPCKEKKEKLNQLECTLDIESYGYSMDDINYKWREKDDQESIDYGLGNFKLVSIERKEKTVTLKSGTYKQLMADFTIEKKA